MSDRKHWILTASGRKWFFDYPVVEDVYVDDLIHGCAQEPRFTGQCGEHYSVAEHSLLVASLVPPEYELEALVHDLHEGVYKDIPTPFKALLPDYKHYEDYGACIVRRALGLPEELSEVVREADTEAMIIERNALLPVSPDWSPYRKNLSISLNKTGKVSLTTWYMAKQRWLRRFNELTTPAPAPTKVYA